MIQLLASFISSISGISSSHGGDGLEAARTSETSVDNYFTLFYLCFCLLFLYVVFYFTRQYIPEDNSELQYFRG